jgi:serine/threonine protein phosphatase PrpC
MIAQVIGASVQGSSHKRSGKECQDSCKNLMTEDALILAVADGHGSDSCPHSKTGSEIAVNVFCKIMSDYCAHYADDTDTLLTFFNREGDTKVAQAIDQEWKRRIRKAHTDNKREQFVDDRGERDYARVYALYGTTLVGLLIMPTFLFAFQLGDGDMIYIDDDGVQPLLATDKILGTETHSLSKMDAWKRALSLTKRTAADAQDAPFAFMLTTDGFSNSYKNEDEYHKSAVGYYDLIKEHGAGAVAANLKQWFTETSKMGCGDDITALIAYFAKEIKKIE